MQLIEKMLPGKLDIVGDVHGEHDALQALLSHLGYGRDGRHPEGRRLVFVGDLVDRGHDSPAVVETVMSLVQAGRAQCVLGNHELNILRDDRKHENAWFFEPHGEPLNGAQAVRPGQLERFMEFFAALPLALERDDLRVVHACWHAPAIAELRKAVPDSTASLYKGYRQRIVEQLQADPRKSAYDAECARFGSRIRYGLAEPERHWPDARLLPGHAWFDELKQMGNPVSVLTSGEERQALCAYPAGGKFRFVDRIPWWNDYRDERAVVVGHYWRRYHDEPHAGFRESGRDLFAGIGPDQWLGRRRRVFCADFSVAGRANGRDDPRRLRECRLAALRWPEATLRFDDGEELATGFKAAAT